MEKPLWLYRLVAEHKNSRGVAALYDHYIYSALLQIAVGANEVCNAEDNSRHSNLNNREEVVKNKAILEKAHNTLRRYLFDGPEAFESGAPDFKPVPIAQHSETFEEKKERMLELVDVLEDAATGYANVLETSGPEAWEREKARLIQARAELEKLIKEL